MPDLDEGLAAISERIATLHWFAQSLALDDPRWTDIYTALLLCYREAFALHRERLAQQGVACHDPRNTPSLTA
jgi:hypothetical protein